jgi:hypothetical protein
MVKKVKVVESNSKGTSLKFHPIIIIILSILIISFYDWIAFPTFLGNNEEASVVLPLVKKTMDETLFKYDVELNVLYKLYPYPVLWVWSKMCNFLVDFKSVFIIISIILSIIFFTGLYNLGKIITNSQFNSLLLVLLSIPIRGTLFDENLWGMDRFVSHPFALSFGMSLTPLFLYFFIKYYEKKFKLSIAFIFMGLSTLLYPYFSIHLFLILMITALIQEKRLTLWIKRMYLPAIVFIISLVPLVLLNLSYLKSDLTFFMTIEKCLPDKSVFTNRFLFDILLMLVISIFTCIYYFKKTITGNDKMILYFILITIIFSSITFLVHDFPIINLIKPWLCSIYFYMIPLIFISSHLGTHFQNKASFHKFLPALVILIILFPSTYIHPLRSYLEILIQGRESDLSKDDKNRLISPRDIQDFIDLCNYCKINSPHDALFLVPPVGFGSFRFYAERSILLSSEVYSRINIFDPISKTWCEKYKDTKSIMSNPDKNFIKDFAGKNKIDFIVIDKEALPAGFENKIGFKVEFCSEKYVLLRIF